MNANALRLPERWSAEQRIVLAAVCVVVCATPTVFHQQFVTGPVINAALLVCAIAVGGPEAAAFGLLPSVFAVAAGTLPAPLLPLVPFIAASNAVLVLTFAALYRISAAGAAMVAALLKFGFLSFVSATLVPQLVPTMATVAGFMFSWPQLATALAGGGIALAVLSRRGGKP